jgi:hypothetical protein
MGHYAQVENGIVTQVIVCNSKQWCEERLGGTWIQTSYNTKGGVHYGQDQNPDGGDPLHKNFAQIGYTWDGIGFATPQPFPSWSLNSDTYLWEAPTPRPNGFDPYYWDESTLSWVLNTFE